MKTGVNKILEQLGAEAGKNQTGVDKIVEILENGGGGGSSLPTYTDADIGKVLTLAEGSESETVVIVPEDTYTATAGVAYPVSDGDASYFTAGQTATMNVNGTDYPVTGIENGGTVGFVAVIPHDPQNIEVVFYEYNGDIFLEVGLTGTYTVSLTASVSSVEPKWVEVSGGDINFVTATMSDPTHITTDLSVTEVLEKGIALLILAGTYFFNKAGTTSDGGVTKIIWSSLQLNDVNQQSGTIGLVFTMMEQDGNNCSLPGVVNATVSVSFK